MGLEYNLSQERVMHLDLRRFTAVESGTPVRDTVQQMRAENHNCALITRGGELVGIFTDRDILRRVVSAPETWDAPIDTVMTPNPLAVRTTDPAEAAISLMNEKRFRNVPVLDEQGNIQGNLTHYAIIKYLADRFPESVYNLPPDPDRVSEDRDGA